MTKNTMTYHRYRELVNTEILSLTEGQYDLTSFDEPLPGFIKANYATGLHYKLSANDCVEYAIGTGCIELPEN